MPQYVEPENFDKSLRLGDVINGFSHIMPNFDDFINNVHEFTLDVKPQQFFVVLTPCCSIENKLITVVPLNKLPYSLFRNPYFVEDFTRINRPILQEKAIPPEAWENFSEEKKLEIKAKKEGYTWNEMFIYGPHEQLPQYAITFKNSPPINCSYYAIDFKEAFTITSKKIQRGATYPKKLQLSISSRGELRNKLGDFFSRVPDEDLA